MSIQVSGVYGGGAKINGVKNEYPATANIAKGDFVQLTTTGVEEPLFTDVAQFAPISNIIKNVGACVLSSTQVIYTYTEATTWSSTASVKNIYAQAATYINGGWVLGTKVLVHSAEVKKTDVNVGRFTDNRAVIAFGINNTKLSVFILEVDTNGEITVLVSEVGVCAYTDFDRGILKVIGLTSESFVVLFPYNSELIQTGCLSAMAFTYIGGILAHSSIKIIHSGSVASGAQSGSFDTACKLNDNAVFIVRHNARGFSDYHTSYTDISILHINGTTISVSNIDTIYSHGPVCQMAENVVCYTPVDNHNCYLFTYDPSTDTLSGSLVLELGEYAYFDSVKLSDDKVCLLVGKAGSADPSVYQLLIIDLKNLTYGLKATTISPAGNLTSGYNDRLDSYAGWVCAKSGRTNILVAPAVSQTTAAPYSTRIDGVASKGAIAGQMAEVVTP